MALTDGMDANNGGRTIHLSFLIGPVPAELYMLPSSAAAERVFSLLTDSFNERQAHSLDGKIFDPYGT